VSPYLTKTLVNKHQNYTGTCRYSCWKYICERKDLRMQGWLWVLTRVVAPSSSSQFMISPGFSPSGTATVIFLCVSFTLDIASAVSWKVAFFPLVSVTLYVWNLLFSIFLRNLRTTLEPNVPTSMGVTCGKDKFRTDGTMSDKGGKSRF
jgi:hypothetical protein